MQSLRAVTRLACLLLASAAAIAPASGATDRATAAVLPSIYVDYGDDCVFAMHADGGIGLTSATAPGTTIPPGDYQVVLRVPQDAPSCPLQFQLQGPGVQLHWDFGGEAIGAQVTETLLPGSTYVATDLRNPARYRAVFSTATSGSSSSLVTQTPSSAGGKGQSSHDPVGSAILAYRGVLNLTVGTAGAPALRARGKAVRSVKAGRYDLTVLDTTPRTGLAVRKPNKSVLTLTSGGFVGTKTTRLALRPGTWRFSSSRGAVRLVVT
jgi:hypothetical protein